MISTDTLGKETERLLHRELRIQRNVLGHVPQRAAGYLVPLRQRCLAQHGQRPAMQLQLAGDALWGGVCVCV